MRSLLETAIEPLAALVADWSLRWAVLVALLALSLLALRPRRAGVRYLFCLVVLLAGLLLPLTPRWGGGFSFTRATPVAGATVDQGAPQKPSVLAPRAYTSGDEPTPQMYAAADTQTPTDVAPPPVAEAAVPAVELPGQAPPVQAPPEPLEWQQFLCLALAAVWGVGVGYLLLRRLAGFWYLHRLRQTASPVDESAAAVFASCCAELGLRRTVTLGAQADVRSPIAFGLVRPLILVPPDWCAQSAAVQRGTLLHELAHLRRRDDWLNILLDSVRIAFFFHPPVRWLLGRLERERELLCDEAVLVCGVEPRDYARMLLTFSQVSGRLGFADSFALLRFGNGRTVKARIYHLLEENMNRPLKPLPRRVAWVLGVLVLACALGAGSVRVRALEQPAVAEPAAPKVEQPKVEKPKVEEKSSPVPKISREALRYDGKSFDQWRTEVLTELKPELRVEGIKALAVFGVNGYGPEATAAILEVAKGYEFSSFNNPHQVSLAGLDAVKEIGATAVPVLREALTNDNKNIRRIGAAGLEGIGSEAKGAVPSLIKSLDDKDAKVRLYAVKALGKIDAEGEAALPAFVKALKDEAEYVRRAAVVELGMLGPKARVAVPALVAVMRDKKVDLPAEAKYDLPTKVDLRAEAMHVLARIHPELKEIIEPVMECYESGNSELCNAAYWLLKSYGKEGGPAVQPLLVLLKKVSAVKAKADDPESGSEKVVGRPSSGAPAGPLGSPGPDPTSPVGIILLLGEIGPAAKEAVEPLLELVQSSNNSKVVDAAKKAVRQIRGQ